MERFRERKAPETLAGKSVRGVQRTAVVAEEDQPAGRGQCAGPGLALTLLRQFPDGFAGLNVEGAEDLLSFHFGRVPPTAEAIAAAGLPGSGGGFRIDVALLERVHIE